MGAHVKVARDIFTFNNFRLFFAFYLSPKLTFYLLSYSLALPR